MREKFDEMVKRMTWVDMQLVKLSVFCIGLPVGAYLSVWILPYWWAFIFLAILAAIKPASIALSKK